MRMLCCGFGFHFQFMVWLITVYLQGIILVCFCDVGSYFS